MSRSLVKADLTKLNKYVKDITKTKVLKVGIFAQNNSRNDDTAQTNASIGAIHEFGSFGFHGKKIHPRSFLRMPLHVKSDEIVKEFQKTGTKELEKGDIIGILKKLGIICEAKIQEAFETKGFGRWDSNAESTVARKGSSSPLIDTGQLRKSIGSKVE